MNSIEKPEVLNLPLLLASQSPRRRQLLELSDFTFRTTAVDIDESFPETIVPSEVPVYLSGRKARAVTGRKAGEILVTADSVVVAQDVIYGKPSSHEDAKETLQKLSGGSHQVITGVTLHRGEEYISFSETTDVEFASLTFKEIDYYIQKYKPYDKAGSYGIQEWIGWCGVKKIRGSWANVMGLPVAALYQRLKSHFLPPES